MQAISGELNAEGQCTTRSAKTLSKMLKNRAHIGEYHYGNIAVA